MGNGLTLTGECYEHERHSVIYRPIRDEPEGVLTKTRSAAWNLGHGEPVVMVEGKSGGVALWAITVVPQEGRWNLPLSGGAAGSCTRSTWREGC